MTHDKHWWPLMKDVRALAVPLRMRTLIWLYVCQMEHSCPDERELLARLCRTYKAALRNGELCV